MPLPLAEMLDLQRETQGRESSTAWHRTAFEIAYCGRDGPFTRVRQRLRRGFSVLVYLPGNCMSAAAEHVQNHLGSRGDWREYGKHKGKGGIGEVWNDTSSLVGRLLDWLQGKEGGGCRAIYHNLNLLSDGRGGLHPSLEAQTAFFSLTEGTRAGVVLALSDSDSGKLPEQVEQVFPEKIWLEAIEFDAFGHLIPVELGRKLAPEGQLADGTAWLIASRLRWTDPIRAVKILHDIGRTLGSGSRGEQVRQALDEIWEATRAMEFVRPRRAPAGGEIRGFQRQVLELLEGDVIAPFERWRDFSGETREECERALKQLPLGLILHGPSGTGKTFLARWLAGAMGLPVRLVNAADIKAFEYGDAEKRVHRLFREVRRSAPCVVVLDDADDLLTDRSQASGGVAGVERGIVNAFLQELEGFEGRPAGVFVILTTNRFQPLDPAVRSRLGTHLHVSYPLDKEQIDELVDVVAGDLGFVLSPPVAAALRDRFFGQMAPEEKPHTTRQDRRERTSNLFSTREIQQAMRRLRGSQATGRFDQEGRYHPNLDDVERMRRYYDPPAE